MPPEIAPLLAPLGVAAPLVGILWWLLTHATNERQTLTNRFLEAQEKMGSANADMVKAMTESNVRFTMTLSEVVTTLKTIADQEVQEHNDIRRLVEAVQQLHSNGIGRMKD